MKMITALVLLAAVSVLPVVANSQASDDALRKQLEANDAVIGRAMHDKDFATLEKFWSPQMLVTNPSNTISTREQVFTRIRTDVINYSHVSNVIDRIQVFDDIVIVMGHEDITMAAGPSAGKPLHRLYTNVWRHRGDSWTQLARQATIISVDAASVYGSSKP